jgi:hypothetical protein
MNMYKIVIANQKRNSEELKPVIIVTVRREICIHNIKMHMFRKSRNPKK